jgi:hypothetical protein
MWHKVYYHAYLFKKGDKYAFTCLTVATAREVARQISHLFPIMVQSEHEPRWTELYDRGKLVSTDLRTILKEMT